MSESKSILVSGATGLVGSALCAHLREFGHEVRRLSRSRGEVRWDPEKGAIAAGALDGIDCVVHLAGEPIARRWTKAVRRRILDSRVRSTELLVREILRLPEGARPDYIAASGTNFYGYRRDELVDERAESGEGFLAEVCRAWEGAAQPLAEAGVRAVFVRTGIVLSADGGALAKMLPPFKAGFGGRIGDGRQKMSWIGLPDLAAIYALAIDSPGLSGPLNAVAPKPVVNQAFTKTLGSVLGRPTPFPLPALMVKTLFGDMGEETLLADLGVVPSKLNELGFEWRAPDLESAIREALEQG